MPHFRAVNRETPADRPPGRGGFYFLSVVGFKQALTSLILCEGGAGVVACSPHLQSDEIQTFIHLFSKYLLNAKHRALGTRIKQ